MIEISDNRSVLGSEFPHCDQIQLVLILLFFAVWSVDSIGFYLFGYSTVLIGLFSLPALLFPAILSLGFSLYLLPKSHQAIFGKTSGQPRLMDTGVYSWVRHPMYLGILLFYLAFFFFIPSLLSFGIWLAFFILYDKMTIYEENDLIRVLGKEYIDYQKRIPKWVPRIRPNNTWKNKQGDD